MEELNKIGEEVIDVVKKIVNNPQEVDINIEEAENEKGEYAKINVKVADEDIPSCIGVNGKTAEALRRITLLIARNNNYQKSIYMRVDAPPLPQNHFYKE